MSHMSHWGHFTTKQVLLIWYFLFRVRVLTCLGCTLPLVQCMLEITSACLNKINIYRKCTDGWRFDWYLCLRWCFYFCIQEVVVPLIYLIQGLFSRLAKQLNGLEDHDCSTSARWPTFKYGKHLHLRKSACVTGSGLDMFAFAATISWTVVFIPILSATKENIFHSPIDT